MQTTPAPIVLDYIKRKITYDPDTGYVIRKGKPFGSKSRGYIQLCLALDIRYEGCQLLFSTRAHQVGWYLTYGVWPDKYIDHIDGDGTNNKLSNLRFATHSENMRNQRRSSKKTSSKYKGVQLVKSRWRAYIQGKHIGYYPTEREAALAYNTMSVKVFGEFACPNVIDE